MPTAKELTFVKEAEGLPVHAMADLVDRSISIPAFALANGAFIEAAKTQSAEVVEDEPAQLPGWLRVLAGALAAAKLE